MLALLAGAYHLGAKSFWLDEAVSAEHARLGLAGLVKVIGGEDPNQGLYYVLLSGWARIFGYGEISLRSLTVVLGALSVPGLAVLGTRLFGRSVGLLSGLLLALSPFFVHYEQTARAYALLVVLVTWSSYFFVCELESPARATRVGYVIASTLAFYAHYFAVYVLLVQLLTLIVVKKRAALTREWLIAGGAIAALCTPEVLAARSKGTLAIDWIPQPSIGSVIHVGSSLGGGGLLAGALLVLASYGLLGTLGEPRQWRTGFMTAWLALPIVVDFAFSALVQPLFVSYYLIVVLPALLLLAALGLVRLPTLATRTLVLAVLIALSAFGSPSGTSSRASKISAARRTTFSNTSGLESTVVYYPTYTADGIDYYDQLARFAGPTPISLALGHAPPAALPRIWLVVREINTPPRSLSELEQVIMRRYQRVPLRAGFRNIAVLLYRRR